MVFLVFFVSSSAGGDSSAPSLELSALVDGAAVVTATDAD